MELFMIMITIMIMIIMHDSSIMHVDRQQKFKTNDHCVSRFEMIWFGDVKSIQNHSFKERYFS